MAASQVIQPTQQSQVATKGQQQQYRGQPTSILVTDDQQAGPFKATYLHIDTNEALQPTVSCLSYRQRKSTQHIRTLKLLWKCTVGAELPTGHHAAVFIIQRATTISLSFNNHCLYSRIAAATSPAPPLGSSAAR